MNGRSIAIVARKDLLDAIRNGRILIVILMPAIFTVVFGFLFSDLDGNDAIEAQVVPVVAPADSSFLSRLSEVHIYRFEAVASHAALTERLRQEDLQAGLILPNDVDDALERGAAPIVEIVTLSDTGQGAGLSALILQTARQIVGQDLPARIEEQPLTEGAPATSEDNGDPGMLIVWLIMALTFTGVTVVPTFIVEEREKRTLQALHISGVSHQEVLIAKAIVGLVYSVLASLGVLALGGGFVGVVGITLATVFVGAWVMVELGLLIGNIFKDMTTLNTYGTFIVLALLLPGMLASFFTAGLFRLGALDLFMRAMPTYYMLDALWQAAQGTLKADHLARDFAVLVGFGLLFHVSVLWVMKRGSAR